MMSLSVVLNDRRRSWRGQGSLWEGPWPWCCRHGLGTEGQSDRGLWHISHTPMGHLQLCLPILANALPETIQHIGSAVRKDNRPILSLIYDGICLSVTGSPEFQKITSAHSEMGKNEVNMSKLPWLVFCTGPVHGQVLCTVLYMVSYFVLFLTTKQIIQSKQGKPIKVLKF